MSPQTFAVADGLQPRVAQVGSPTPSAIPTLQPGDPEVEAALANLFITWITDNNVFHNAFGVQLCDSGIALFRQKRTSELGSDTLSEEFSFLGFWTADFESNSELTLRTQLLNSNDADRPAPLLQDFSIGLTRPPTVDGAPIASVEEVSSSCATATRTLEQECRGNTLPFCRELANRNSGVVVDFPPPAPVPGQAPLQCSALPNPTNACGTCAAGACCDELTACGPGTQCDAVLTCLSACPDLDASCAQRSCAPITQQGLDAAVAVGQCLQADCSTECN